MRQFRRNVVHAGGGLNEFLPDQQTQLVAEAVERFRLNHAPAPDAHDVHIQPLRLMQLICDLFRRNIAVDMIHRRDIDALHIDALAVHDNGIGKRTRRGVLILNHLEVADALAHRPLVQHGFAASERQRHVIERLFAQPVGIPQFRCRDGQRSSECAVLHRQCRRGFLCAVLCAAYRHRQRQIAIRTGRAGNMQQPRAVRCVRMHIKVVQRGFVLQNQRYILPDAQIDQPGAEIPLIPEAALLRRSLACAPNLPHFVRRMENQHIQHEMLRRLQKVGHVKGEILIHALVFAKQMPVQVDHAGVIDTLEVQEGLAVRGDVPAVELAAVFYPLALQAVHVHIGVIDIACLIQRARHAAGNLRVHPAGHAFQRLAGFHALIAQRHIGCCAFELPSAV